MAKELQGSRLVPPPWLVLDPLGGMTACDGAKSVRVEA